MTTPKMSSPHVLIIGAGMSGLTLAQQLKKNNISFTVFERDLNDDSRGQGWALSLFGEALDLMRALMPSELGPVERTSALFPLELPPQFAFYDITRPDFRVGVVVDDTLKAVRANRRRLRDWLMQNIDVKFNKRLLRVEEHGDKVTAYFEDGTSATGDFLVGAEGTRSVVRKHLLQGQDVMKPLPVGSIFGETSLSDDDFSQQLTLSHSNYIVMDSRLPPDQQAVIFGALNRVSPDGKTGYYYYILLWVDHQAPTDAGEKRWFESASKEQLAAFAREKTKGFPDNLRSLVDRIPIEGYNAPGFQLQGVELELEQLPAGRVLLIGDAAHSMAPFRALAANTAFVDAFKLGEVLTRARDMQASGETLKDLVSAFNVDMITRGKAAIKASNSVLEAYGEETKFVTFGREARPIPLKTVVLSDHRI
ncbi:putative monooxygenase [Talaromyces proteolyticus]|uniref:Monooxygenase n=1 Tax=Talaromyces proteolyticus TaxID=1131652 RepID=A0AAD4L3S5_9EURO|nr:putative monooxygenase [Talaromyces proteolyticus]KAH8703678.1 putative monooxygenase [Talaromyces proteolyticus]